MKNTAVTEFLLVLATVALTGMFAIGCGGDPACENGGCGPDPDAGTNGDGNPITKEDGGTLDGGDVTSGDAGSDAGQADCSAIKAKYEKTWTLKSGCVMLIGETMTATVEGTADDCVTTFDGACRIALPFRGKYPNTALKAGPTDGVSATA